jgi:hypothetical protein
MLRNRGGDPVATETAVSQDTARSDALIHAARPHRTLWRDTFNRLIANRLALFGLIVISVIAFLAVFAPWVAPHDYRTQYWDSITQYPSREWPLGTDNNGRDMLSRMIYGARVSMAVGLGAQLIILAIGVPVGAIAGYMGGKTDNLLMRFTDFVLAVPGLAILLTVLAFNFLGESLRDLLDPFRRTRMSPTETGSPSSNSTSTIASPGASADTTSSSQGMTVPVATTAVAMLRVAASSTLTVRAAASTGATEDVSPRSPPKGRWRAGPCKSPMPVKTARTDTPASTSSTRTTATIPTFFIQGGIGDPYLSVAPCLAKAELNV